jgi:L-alanine-DL-glutamate epimerase-like enolase superfamily enzyme
MWSRRRLLQAITGAIPISYQAHAAAAKGRVRIAALRTMVLQGPRSYVLVRVVTDAGVSGVGEAYGSPAVGVREAIHELKGALIGQDPIDIEALLVRLGGVAGSGSAAFVQAASGIEMAVWDTVGKLLGVPVASLLGGRFRDRIRVYPEDAPKNPLDRSSCREWADRIKSSPQGWTACQLGVPRVPFHVDRTRDAASRTLTSREVRDLRKGLENCRDALGQDCDLIVNGEGAFGLRSAVQVAEAAAPAHPLFLRDPLPPGFHPAWVELCRAASVPIAGGESLARRQGFRELIVQHGCDVVQTDVRNAGGLLEAKKIADLADLYYLPVAAVSTGTPVALLATAHWAAAVRDFVACEVIAGQGNWLDDVILHEGPLVRDGYLAVPDQPGLGVELNKEVVKANLARGEKYWD